ncbi:ATP-binding protein [Streptomyces sp. PTM05]|uniref:ATP-binding protein n=1 Tax=Streptantibioticus parmotrematis TaxID=2873249 RepID=A0ABS7QNZ0_9ACTN|nr:ATP-binding protein [Streptantibioticus parmotrematis]MBY8884902.1 ATP-binding protein [Streptantibioticus parmotrematis]
MRHKSAYEESASSTTNTLRFDIPGQPYFVSVARRRLVATVRDWNGNAVAADAAEAVGLVASELLTNAVSYAEGSLAISLRQEGTRVLLEVRDQNPQLPMLRCPSEDDEHGRGLALASALALRCGWETVAGGKVVWAELAVCPAQPDPTVRRPLRPTTLGPLRRAPAPLPASAPGRRVKAVPAMAHPKNGDGRPDDLPTKTPARPPRPGAD